MNPRLLSALLRLAVAPDSSLTDAARSCVAHASPLEWAQALEELRWHALVPLVAWALHTHGLKDLVPPQHSGDLGHDRRLAAFRQTVQMKGLEEILRAFHDRGVVPVIWKGAALVNALYPDVGTRGITDLDLLIEEAQETEADEALRSLGYSRRGVPLGSRERDAANYDNLPRGLEVDLHWRCRLFEGFPAAELTETTPPRFLGVESIRVYEPNAMLTHLVVHLDEHRVGCAGCFLPWVVDILLLFRSWGARLDLRRLEELLPPGRARTWLWRLAGFAEGEMGIPLPAFLSGAGARVSPLTLSEALRGRRLGIWGLPGWRGWARLAAHRLGIRAQSPRPRVTFGEAALGIVDSLRDGHARWRGSRLPWGPPGDRP